VFLINRRNIIFTVQAVVTTVLLVLLFRRFDWARFVEVLQQLPAWFYAGSLAVLTIGQVLYAYRWRVVLAGMGVDVPFAEVLRQYFIGIFFSNLMPTAVGGDASKVYYLGQRAGFVPVTASVILDRLLGFVWLSLIGAVLAWLVGGDAQVLVLNRQLLTLFAAGFASALLVAWLVPVERLLPRLVPARWCAWTARVSEFVMLVRQGVCRPVTFVAAGVIVGVYAWLIAIVYQQYFAVSGLAAIATMPVLLVIVSMAIFVNVPITVGGIGLREQLHVLLFTAFGVPREVAVTISLVLFSQSLLLSLLGGALWLRIRPATVAA
jgi:uncharacterized membrane protein YbhN (UPF0104 family)